MGLLQLYLLGPPEVRLGAKLAVFPTRKTLALLVYLALEPGPHAREHLAALLWPDARPERSYASLRNTLSHLLSVLRRDGGPAASQHLTKTRQTLALNPEAGLYLDLQTVEQAYALARADRSSRAPPDEAASLPALQAAVACQRGDFLAGFSLGDAPAFDDWVGMQREAWRRRSGLILDRLSEIQFARGELAGAAETASLWISLDGLNEVAYRRKMRAHFAAGERGQALEAYEACRALLATELKVEPEAETQALAARIRAPHSLQSLAPHTSQPQTPVNYLEAAFAGRSREQEALAACYHLATAGQPQVVVLRGEAGIGKTRLANAFLARARRQGATVLQGGAFESGSHMPFQPWVDAVRTALERGDAPAGWLGEAWLSPLTQLMPELRNRHPEGSTAFVSQSQAPSAAGQAPIFEALVRFTLAQAEQAPLVVVLDDLQWVDSATLEVIQYALRRWRASAARILLLVSLRSEALQPSTPLRRPSLSDWLAQVERELEPRHLKLEPLSETETVQLVRSLLAPPDPDFAKWVFDETHGQPFYLMETLKDLLERGALHPTRRAEGQWTFAVDAEHDLGQAVRVPSTVRAVIRSRLNRLSPNALSILAAGAVLEKRPTFARLCAVANLTQDLGLPALDEVLSSQLLLEVARPGLTSLYGFANDMVRDVVYTEAGDARRRLFHRRALEVLEAEKDSAAALAHHALAAGVALAAFRHSLSAGQEALHLSATDEARAHFENARQLTRKSTLVTAEIEAQIRDLYTQLGQAYELSGHPEQAAAVYAEQARLAAIQPREND